MNRLHSFWIDLRASLWFVPSLIVLGSMLAAVLMTETEGRVGTELVKRWPRLLGASADASRAILAAIATSMVTVAGVVFSITIVALSLTSTQYSPRVLRNFMRDRPTQVVLGVFMGIFAYCLIVLRTVRGAEDGDFIPSLAVLAGMVYALAGVALLIYFIHHVAQSIQAASILERIAHDTAGAIEKLFPQDIGQPAAHHPALAPVLPRDWTAVRADQDGYVTGIDSDSVLQFALDHGRIVRLAVATGAFVVTGSPVVELSGTDAPAEDDAQRLRGWVSLAPQRAVEQDAAFGLQQLVDVALKALSPGINDPTTACMCIDRLGALLARLASRRIPDPHRMAQGRLRVIAPAPDFAAIVKLALDPVVAHSRGDLQVLGRMLDAIGFVAKASADPQRHASLAHATRNIYRELCRVEPLIRSAPARRRARLLERSLRNASIG
ncbi:hypothetical protein [Polaromonas sp. CG9_12]|uniref:DUF2254 domain-containing protein n=1 Tax=Polaromonas sp. CG_9.11 TaxID=2787730 RepID=UPI0004DDD63B|nr:DUF2254 domain-containing protein [Polaromonas sp. CG_9.11]MBG6075796.1 putative membrane protein [Polaromonas sp. CG_9.11]CDS51621.1 hypothetical protein [Polaromonas sp. CG9_12]